MPDFTLTATGLQTPRFPEARALVVEKWKGRFGDNAQTGSDSPDGLVIDVIALMLALAWEGVADVHAGSYFRTAAGTSLDLILDLFGRRRLAAVASTASAVWYGAGATVVPIGSVTSVADSGVRFASDAAGTTVASGVGGPVVVLVEVAVDGDTYAVDVDTTVESTAVAGGSSTPDSIADLLVTQLRTDNPTATINRGGVQPVTGDAVIIMEGLGLGVVTVGASATVAGNTDLALGVRVDMTAEVKAADAALAGTLNTIETPIASIDGVATTADAVVGRLLETDPDYRGRHLDQIHSGGAASPEAIRARILALLTATGLPLIEYARVFENVLDVIDGSGRPPHSIEAVWVGPVGTDAEDAVAAEIYAAKAAGINTFGTTASVVLDTFGGSHAINHSRAVERYLHLDVTVVPGEGYPTTGTPLVAIQTAIATFLDDEGDGELGLGDDLYHFSLGEPINLAVPGVASVTITSDDTTNPGDSPTLDGSDVTVADGTILRVDSSRIAVHL